MQTFDQALQWISKSSSPLGPNRVKLAEWLRKQKDPIFLLAAMAAQPVKIRRNAYVKLTGFTFHPQGKILDFSDHQIFFRDFAGSNQPLGTLESPKRMNEEEIRSLVKVWKNHCALQLISNVTSDAVRNIVETNQPEQEKKMEMENIHTIEIEGSKVEHNIAIISAISYQAEFEALAKARGVATELVVALYQARSELHGRPWSEIEPAVRRSITSWKAAQTAKMNKRRKLMSEQFIHEMDDD